MRELFLIILCASVFSAKAQDPQFSQFYAAPQYLNPAFTGNTEQSRITANYRNQWPAVPNSVSFVSYTAAYDHNLEYFNSGLGIIATRDEAGTAALSNTTVGVSYAYKVRLNRKWAWKTGLQFNFGQRSINYDDLIFGDQLLTGNTSSASSAAYTGQSVSYMDINSGTVLYSRDFWLGVAVHHLNQPNQSLVGGKAPLPMKYSAHAGYKIPLKQNIKHKTIASLLLAANYKRQLDWDQLEIGSYVSYDPFIFGAWYRGFPFKEIPGVHLNNEAIVALLGYTIYDFKIGYSYDVTISSLTPSISGGAHEVAIVWEWSDPSNKRKRRRPSQMFIPCPSF